MKRTLLLTTAIVLLAGIANAAPIQWDGNGHWYDRVWLYRDLDWEAAKAFAEESGGHLATLTSHEENDFVWMYLFKNPEEPLAEGTEYRSYWLGASDVATEGVWTWVTGEPWGFQPWHLGEPNNGLSGPYAGVQDYLHFWDTESGQWDDMDNRWHMGGFVVEYDQAPVPTPEPSTLFLLGSGLIGLAGLRRRFSKSE